MKKKKKKKKRRQRIGAFEVLSCKAVRSNEVRLFFSFSVFDAEGFKQIATRGRRVSVTRPVTEENQRGVVLW